MPIPSLNEHGLLPQGIHACSLRELQHRFCRFQGSDRRPRLFARLEEFLAEVKSSGIVVAVILDGSFVTAKAEPGDIDMILVLRENHDFAADLPLAQYNVVEQRRVRRVYGLDIVVVNDSSEDYDEAVAFFQQVKARPALEKGLLKIAL